MESAILEKKTSSSTEQNILSFIKTHEAKFVAEDAIFINLATGEETKGREAIGAMLYHVYHVAFDAAVDLKNVIITEDKAMFEGYFTGKHIGEFAGMPPTNKNVRVPLCVSYDVKDGLIKQARIFMLVNVMMQQLQG